MQFNSCLLTICLVVLCSAFPGARDGCIGDVPLDTDGSAAATAGKQHTEETGAKKKIYASPPKSGGCGYSLKVRFGLWQSCLYSLKEMTAGSGVHT